MATPPTPSGSRPNPDDSSRIRLEDGFATLVAFAANPTIGFYESSDVTPPGIDMGDAIPTSTHHNTAWSTFAIGVLKTLTPMTLTAAYDPIVHDEIAALAGVYTTCTVFFPDRSTLAFYCVVQKWEPGGLNAGEMPTGVLTVLPTNRDDAGLEAGPFLTNVAGT